MDQLSFHSENVHLWSTALNVSDQIMGALKQHLSPDERDRADHYVFSQDRLNFMVSRGILRDILSRYLFCRPEDIRFRYEPNGKPGLDFTKHSISFDFNLSHSSGRLVVAVTQGKEVGVDIELVRSMPDMDLMASHSFSEYERNKLSLLIGEEKRLAFFRCWTRKEAYLKAVGSGLAIPLDSFDVSLEPNNPIGLVSNHRNPDQLALWSFYTYYPFEGFIGAFAIKDQVVIPAFREWNPQEG